jgi:hypothetical protein
LPFSGALLRGVKKGEGETGARGSSVLEATFSMLGQSRAMLGGGGGIPYFSIGGGRRPVGPKG